MLLFCCFENKKEFPFDRPVSNLKESVSNTNKPPP